MNNTQNGFHVQPCWFIYALPDAQAQCLMCHHGGRRHRHVKKNIKSTTNLTRARNINQPTFCRLPNCLQEQKYLRKQTSGKKKPEKREIKWTRSERRDTGGVKQEAGKIPVEAGQCLQAAAGSCIPLLNLNQTQADPSWNQCPNQDEPLRRTRCTEKDVGGR